ncbi:hypothetical protein E8P82_08965 [Arthrobacter echini]|uniref:Uncharacterized protein n=1 Tax=Arthrobacter echini TaxID=1529066 RepID=A0A4S5E565_9MICC|nr:hypothetical protein [Arthrobacter echini]THJ66570.1 hypothetical protein E8P82_08965 [Arthrobacter echini]
MSIHKDTTESQRRMDPVTRRREGLTTFFLILVGALVTIGIATLTDLDTLPRILITVVAMLAAYPVIRTVLPKQTT